MEMIAMRQMAIFFVSLPILVLAILWFPLGAAFSVAVMPVFIMMTLIDLLRGEKPDWQIMIIPPLAMFELYGDITGFFDLDL